MISINRKGFTLIELLAVIVILAIILAIAIPSISSMISNVQFQAYVDNKLMMIKAAKTYVSVDDSKLPRNVGETREISLATLQSENYISIIKDPKNKANTCDGYVLITKTSTNDYDYESILDCVNSAGSSSEDGLVAFFKFDGNAIDHSINNNTPIVYGATPIQDRFGRASSAYAFDGDDYLIKTSPNISSKTISAWAKFTQIEGIRGIVFVNSTNYHMLCTGDYGSRFATIPGTSASAGVETVNTFNDGIWHHVVALRDTNEIYVDGVKVPTRTDTNDYSAVDTDALVIGRRNDYYYFIGSIDDVRIYNRTLSAYEIKHLYELEKKQPND